jgi:tetratricopeptide (TPR) repeat protein
MKRRPSIPIIALLALGLFSSATTVNGAPLQDTQLSPFVDRAAPPVSPDAAQQMGLRLSEAQAVYKARPNDPDAIIWLGRRLAYPGRFREAIDIFSEGIKKFPRDARFYRHRGHRYITLRRFDLAIKDFEKAASLIKGKPDEIEPDGQPNARGIPTSTLQFNIWYHLGLAQYLSGNYRPALASYRECLKVSKNPDALVATSHWLYMTLRRLNRIQEAAQVLEQIRPGLEIIENDGYYRLLLMSKGTISVESLLQEALKQEGSAGSYSVLYGIGSWYMYNGRLDEARGVFLKMLAGNQWTSFGYIAAEADMKRLKGQPNVNSHDLVSGTHHLA